MDYPVEFPLVEVKTIISTVKDGQVKEKFADLAHSVWVVQGYAQANVIGLPGVEPVTPVDLQSAEDFDPIGALEAMAAAHESGELQAQDLNDWSFLLNWLIDNLVQWVKDWLNLSDGGEG
jgi:hypothetical protein